MIDPIDSHNRNDTDNAEQYNIHRQITLIETDKVPSKHGVGLKAEVTQPLIDADHLPRIQITIKNQTDVRLDYPTKYREVFGGIDSMPGSSQLMLLLPQTSPVGCNNNFRPDESHLVFDSIMPYNRLDGGESRTTELVVWDHPNNTGGPFAIGTYRFESLYGPLEYETSSKKGFSWGFSVSVNDIMC